MSKVKSKKPVVYSALQVADLCGVVNQTAINWIRSDYLKAFKTPGGQFRVYPEDLKKFMESRNMRIPEELLRDCGEERVVDPLKLLIVEDDRAWNNVMMEYLNKQYPDMEISQAFDGFEAGSMMVVKQPKCIILDLDLPGVDGLKLCRHIKESDAFGKPEIIVVTSLQDNEIEGQCKDLGVSKFYRKPMSLPDLQKSIETFMDDEPVLA